MLYLLDGVIEKTTAKAIFSHMNALYFYEMTEEFPSNYTITVPLKYHVEKMSEKHAVFYVSEKIYELGMIDVKTPSGNIVKAYDKERHSKKKS